MKVREFKIVDLETVKVNQNETLIVHTDVRMTHEEAARVKAKFAEAGITRVVILCGSEWHLGVYQNTDAVEP